MRVEFAVRRNLAEGSLRTHQRIQITTDGSKLSDRAVEHAIVLADLTGAELAALRITPRGPQTYFEGGIALGTSEAQTIERQ